MTDRSPIRNTDAGARLLVDLRSEIARADSKASVLVAALGMTAGVISGWLAGSGWRPSALSAPGTALWWTGTGGLATALLAMLMAVLPATAAVPGPPGPRSPTSRTSGAPPGRAGYRRRSKPPRVPGPLHSSRP